MQPKKYFYRLAIFLTALFMTQSAAALQITYTNSSVGFKQGYSGLNAYDFFRDSNKTPGVRAFDISFTGIANGLTTTLISADLTLGTTAKRHEDAIIRLPDASLLKNLPVKNGSMTFAEDGSLSAWNFYFSIVDKKESLRSSDGGHGAPPVDNNWMISSTYGPNTCNCDLFTSKIGNYAPRPYGTWVSASPMELRYGGKTSPDNWSMETTQVSEPTNYLLLLLGLGAIFLARIRNKKFTPSNQGASL